MRIVLIGGTGKEGRGLAMRWAAAGHQVVLGSRDAARAAAAAQELARATGRPVEGGENAAALAEAQVAVLCVPYASHADTLRALKAALAGRVLIDITVPLKPPHVAQVNLPPGLSAALEAQEILGPAAHVVSALHHVSATQLVDPDKKIECDVLVCADDAAAKDTVLGLIKDLGLRGLDAGPLRNSIALEALTPVLLSLNKKYKRAGAGIRITNLDLT